jgi:hypothetical protein
VNHADVKKNLADYLEGDLAVNKRAVVDAHLDDCEECALEVSEMEQTIRLLRTLPEPESPPMMAADVMRRIRAGEAEPGFLTRIGRSIASVFEPSFMLPASAIAAAAIVVVVLQDPTGPANPNLAGGPGQPSANGLDEAVLAWAVRDTTGAAKLTAKAPVPWLAAREAVANRATSISHAAASATPGWSDRSGGLAFGAAQGTGRVLAGGPPPPFLAQAATVRSGEKSAVVGPDRIVIRGRLANANASRDRFGMPTGSGLSGAMPVAGPISQQLLNSLRAQPARVSVPFTNQGRVDSNQGFSAAGSGDPRDAWLAVALDRPVDFARFLVDKSLAEQELWVARLSDRAESRGLLDELVQMLEGTEDIAAGVLAADFVAARDAATSSGTAGAP